ncbi:MAG: sensor histidine kinase, partial [Nitriliruptorales bacterium]
AEDSPWMARASAWLRWGRLAAVAAAAVLQVVDADPGVYEATVLVAAFAYAFVRCVTRARQRLWVFVWTDLAVAAGLVALTGGWTSPYALLALLTAAEAGLLLGVRSGIAGGALLSLLLLPSFHDAAPADVLSTVVLFPLVGLTGALVAKVWGPAGTVPPPTASDANRLLREMNRIARAAPSDLELGTAGRQVLDDVRRVTGAAAACLFLDEGREALLLASYGVGDVAYRPFAWDDVAQLAGEEPHHVTASELEPPLSRLLGSRPEWLSVALIHRGLEHGVLVVAAPEGDPAPLARLLMRLREGAAIRIENARLFQRLRDLAVDVEAWRVAGDLHDGVAQGLAHLRLELELMARSSGFPDIQEETTRLARVATRLQNEVREVVFGLRATAAATGLAATLREHTRDFSGPTGPTIRFEARAQPPLPPDVERQVFRIAQEAIANARRHAAANTVTVRIGVADDELVVAVEDDGHGRPEEAPTGHGIRIMTERAARIGGRLAIADREGGGTTVELRLPLVAAPAPEPRPLAGTRR